LKSERFGNYAKFNVVKCKFKHDLLDGYAENIKYGDEVAIYFKECGFYDIL
jgi:hypothetical protein